MSRLDVLWCWSVALLALAESRRYSSEAGVSVVLLHTDHNHDQLKSNAVDIFDAFVAV